MVDYLSLLALDTVPASIQIMTASEMIPLNPAWVRTRTLSVQNPHSTHKIDCLWILFFVRTSQMPLKYCIKDRKYVHKYLLKYSFFRISHINTHTPQYHETPIPWHPQHHDIPKHRHSDNQLLRHPKTPTPQHS